MFWYVEFVEQSILYLHQMFTTTNGDSSIQLKVFEKFTDPSSFTQMVSRLMVTEIRRRASNKTTESASIAIVEFLEISPTVTSPVGGDNKKGWILLSTLNILVSFQSAHLISIMTSNSLASTLVKCLYLFFDLPPPNASEESRSSDQSDCLSQTERRQLLQKVFSQLLSRLCSSPSALTDLTKKDDLLLLFNAVTSHCPEHNFIWRQTASDVIITMAKHGNVNVEYLHSKNCIGLFMENVHRIFELGTTKHRDIILMYATFVHFLYEYTGTVTINSMVQVLLDDFGASFGYQFIVDFALKMEQQTENDADISELLQLTQQFTKIGLNIIKPRPLSVNNVFIIDQFQVPRPSKNSVKNLKAFNIIVSLWTRCKQDRTQRVILDTILAIYKEDKANYFILEGQNTLSSLAEKLEEKSDGIQLQYYGLLKYVVFELNYVPCKELISVGIVLKRRFSDSSMLGCLQLLYEIANYNGVFRDVFREIGLLDIICSLYCFCIQLILTQDLDCKITIFNSLIELLITVLAGNAPNCTIFHECGASKQTFTLVAHQSNGENGDDRLKSLHKRCFVVIQHLILANVNEDNLAQLLMLLHMDRDACGANVQNMFNLKLSALKTLTIVLSENHKIRALFRKSGGFVSVMSVIVHMENGLVGSGMEGKQRGHAKRVWDILRCIFATLMTAMRFEPANAKYFSQEICFPSLTDSLRLLGCFSDTPWSFKQDDDDDGSIDKYEALFHQVNLGEVQFDKLTRLECACLLMRLIYEMAIDCLDRSKSGSAEDQASVAPNHLSNVPCIVYPCTVVSMIQLIQFIPSSRLCTYLLDQISSLLMLDRNVQTLCELNLVQELLTGAYVGAFLNENHPLHGRLMAMFERLSCHHIHSKSLR